jgi:hypothetical protein
VPRNFPGEENREAMAGGSRRCARHSRCGWEKFVRCQNLKKNKVKKPAESEFEEESGRESHRIWFVK